MEPDKVFLNFLKFSVVLFLLKIYKNILLINKTVQLEVKVLKNIQSFIFVENVILQRIYAVNLNIFFPKHSQ